MSTTSIKFELREHFSADKYNVRKVSESELGLKKHALDLQGREEREFKIVSVITTESTLDIFTVPAYKPDWETVARDIACVYAQSIDWDNEDFLALSVEDQAKVKEYVEHETDDCENCGWTFESHYLSDTGHGRICDRCESDLADEEDEEDED